MYLPSNLASITNVNDFNRDGTVNATDQQIAHNNSTSPLTSALTILNLPSGSFPLPPPPAPLTILSVGTQDYQETGFAAVPMNPTPTVTWSPLPSAMSYHLSISLHSNGSNPVQTFPLVTGTSQTINPIAANTNYYVVLTATDGSGNTITAPNNDYAFVWQVSHRMFCTSSTYNVVTSNQFPPGPGELGV